MADKRLLISVSGAEIQVAVATGSALDSFSTEPTVGAETYFVGNIYVGKIVHIEPALQATFVDIGVGRTGFLHVTDIEPKYLGTEKQTKPSGEQAGKMPRMEDVFKRGDSVLVQVIKKGNQSKGPVLSTYISVPGKYLVLMPSLGRIGVSGKISDEDERKRLEDVLSELATPGEIGFIVRSSGDGRSKDELARDLSSLKRRWNEMSRRITEATPPQAIYEELDPVSGILHDEAPSDFDEIWIDDQVAVDRAQDTLESLGSPNSNRVYFHQDHRPIFDKFGLAEQIAKELRFVHESARGSEVIDQFIEDAPVESSLLNRSYKDAIFEAAVGRAVKPVMEEVTPQILTATHSELENQLQRDVAAVRQFVDDALSEDELHILCFDLFRDVYRQFTAGQTRSRQVLLLVDHVSRRRKLHELVEAVQSINKSVYEEFAGRLFG